MIGIHQEWAGDDNIFTIVGIQLGRFQEIYSFRNHDDAVDKWEKLTGCDYYAGYDFYNGQAKGNQSCAYYLNEVSLE